MWCDLVDGVVGGACAGGSSLAMFSGALTSSLSITSMGLADQREYRCVASTGCGLRTSEPALLTVCLPDVNCDLETDILDFLDFLDAFGRGC